MRLTAVYVGLSLAGGQIAMAVAYIVTARAIRPVDFGFIVSAIAVAAVIAGLWDFGQSVRMTRRLSRMKWARVEESAKSMVRLIILIVILTLATVTLASSGVIDGLVAWTALLTVSVQSPLTVAALSLQSMARSLDQHRRVAMIYFIGRLLALILVLGAETLGISAIAALSAGLILGLGFEIASLTPYLWRAGFFKVRMSYLLALTKVPGTLWRGGAAFGVSATLASSQQLDLPIATFTGGAETGAEYGAISRWTQPLLLPSSAATLVATPAAMRAHSLRSASKAVKPVTLLVLASGAIGIVVAMLSPILTSILLGSNYEDSAPALAILAIATVTTAISQPVVMIIHARNGESQVAKALIVATGIRLGGAAVLSPVLGAIGVAASVLAQQIVLLALLFYIAWRIDRHEQFK